MSKNIFFPVSWWAFSLNFLVLIVAVFLILLNRQDLPPVLPLWFSKPWGSERLASPFFLWLLPLIILFLLLLNNILARILVSKHRVLALLLVWSGLIISLIILFPLYRILLVII